MANKTEQSAAPRNRRHKLFVDPQVQGLLLMRVVSYWMLAVFVIILLIGYQVFLSNSSESVVSNFQRLVNHCEPALLAALAILPVILLDCLRVTSKFAGPLVRLRQEIRNLADGEPAEQLRFRKNDLCHELTDEFNRLVEHLQKPEYETRGQTEKRSNVSHEEPVAVG